MRLAWPVDLGSWRKCYIYMCHSFFQIVPMSSLSATASLNLSVELWMSLWTGHWVVEKVLISTSSTLPPMLPRPHMEDFWISPQAVRHWLVLGLATSTTSQYVVSTVGVRRGGRVSPWQLHLKVSIHGTRSEKGIHFYKSDTIYVIYLVTKHKPCPWLCLVISVHCRIYCDRLYFAVNWTARKSIKCICFTNHITDSMTDCLCTRL